MPALVLKLLGGFEASVEGGAAIPLASKTGQALVAFLALTPDRRHSRDKLATLLWEDRPDEQARTSLRQTLAVLRRALPTECLRAEADWIALAPDACRIDVAEFERLAARNDAASLEHAAILYRGAFLDGFHLRSEGFGGWLRGERERLQERALQVLRGTLVLQSQAKDKAPAIATAGRLLALDPADEATHRALMRLYAADGRTDAALRQYQLCREHMRRELDVAPQPETEALYQDLLSGRARPAAVPSGAARRAAPMKSDVPSIVVLPFVDQSGDPAEAHIGDGITEDIIIELSRYRSLLVIARSSAFQFRGVAVDIAAIRQRLGVRFVVEGSLRKMGRRLRVSAQLIDSESESTLWAERYDRSQEEIFEVQDQVASAIASTLEGRIVSRGAERVRRKPTKEWDAYDHYLQGRELLHRYRTPEAVPHLSRAIAIDPTYGQAYALRSMAVANAYVIGGCTEPEKLAMGLADAQHALALDDEDGSSHEAMGYALLWSDRKEEAGKHFDRALALNPTDVDITCDRANWLLCVGRLDEALEQLDAAMRRDPYPPVWAWEVRGSVLYRLQRYEEALAAFQKVDTDFYWIPAFIAACYGQLGRKPEAERALAKFRKLKPDMTIATIDGLFPYVGDDWLAQLVDGLRKAGFPE
jgi:TolB-like protein/Flp pilus assembly protein TadD